jgi:hypoxanthine phosphoribosyltransferase
LHQDIDRILIAEDELKAKVAELGRQLAAEYRRDPPIFVGVLNGSAIFMADLTRACPIRLSLDFMAVSSYGAGTRSSGVVRILKDLDRNIEGRRVVIVEDIVDTGLTLSYLIEHLHARQPESIQVCALLDKHDRRATDVRLDYVGFQIPDEFVVGYGLDFNDLYRNLPYVGVLRPHLYSSQPHQCT